VSGGGIIRLAETPTVEIRTKRDHGAPMHLKSYQVDGKLLRTGAANFSASGLKRQDNDLIVIDSAGAAAASLSASFVRIDGSSTIPSMMISETWIPDGPSERARDSARLRWAALAEANATVLAPPRREAVAPMKIMCPAARRFIAGMTLRAAAKAPKVLVPRRFEIFEGHLLAEPQTPLPAL
jgi:hypothetical protein